MNWTKERAIDAAASADRLADLLGQEGFIKEDALQWLGQEHIQRFLGALCKAEVDLLWRTIVGWHYTNDAKGTAGFPLLDNLTKAHRNSQPDPDSAPLVAALIADAPAMCLGHRPLDVVARWLHARVREWTHVVKGNYSYKKDRKSWISSDPLSDACLRALTHQDFQLCMENLDDAHLAAIVARRSDVLANTPQSRAGAIVGGILAREMAGDDTVRVMAALGVPSNASALIDAVLRESEAIELLDGLVERWVESPAPDPVTASVGAGHQALVTFLRSTWPNYGVTQQHRLNNSLWPRSFMKRAVAVAVQADPRAFRLPVGYTIGVCVAESEEERERHAPPDAIHKHLNDSGVVLSDRVVGCVRPMVELWATLHAIARYQKESWQHKTELLGLRARLFELSLADPSLWAEALTWILVRTADLGDAAQVVTLGLALDEPSVRTALEAACEEGDECVRLRARGLQTMLRGLEDPGSDLSRTLADIAARIVDGITVFPHPLNLRSATWLGDIRVEQLISDGIDLAADRFRPWVRDHGANVEEALTERLASELEFAFRGVKPRLRLLSSGGTGTSDPVLSVQQRPASKVTEEPEYGCDMAWLLRATVCGRYAATWVDLVQVKKSKRFHTSNAADAWNVDQQQLERILKWSQTAAYWLVTPDGSVLVVPARHLAALGAGRERRVKSFTVGYHEVRSAAIPLRQYMLDLLIGQWVGTTQGETVGFVKGEDSKIRPRVVVEVQVSYGHEGQDQGEG